MRERRQIVGRWRQGEGSILATLVRLQGSGYRQLGARLLICNSGKYEGCISAGCLESDLLRKAAWFVRDGATVRSYSTLLDETAEVPFGLGCGGVLDVLLEPVESPECAALFQAMEMAIQGREHRVITWLPRPGTALRRAIFTAEGKVDFASSSLTENDLEHAWANGSSEESIFAEVLLPSQRLFIFGAGEDARPLVTMAHLLGWSVTVMDSRSHLLRRERFPGARLELADASHATIQEIDAPDAVVLMTHSYEQDRDFLAALLPRHPKYLGLLGARKRSAMLMAEAAARLQWQLADCCERVSAPVGLDLGGDGPEAIALAIIAEIQACCMGKDRYARRLSIEDAQRFLGAGDASSYLRNQCGLSTI